MNDSRPNKFIYTAKKDDDDVSYLWQKRRYIRKNRLRRKNTF